MSWQAGRKHQPARAGVQFKIIKRGLPLACETVGVDDQKGNAGFGPRRPRALHPPAVLREREGRRFAGEGSTASPQPQTLPADREARRRPSRSRSAAGG